MLRGLFSRTIFAFVTILPGVGCSTYTLTRITAAEARSDFPEGATYRVTPPQAVLIRAPSTSALGVGQPRLELDRRAYPDLGQPAIDQVPAGTWVKIEQYIRFDQHGFYDCGWDGWRFAIASIPEGKLRGTRFLIRPNGLHLQDHCALLGP